VTRKSNEEYAIPARENISFKPDLMWPYTIIRTWIGPSLMVPDHHRGPEERDVEEAASTPVRTRSLFTRLRTDLNRSP